MYDMVLIAAMTKRAHQIFLFILSTNNSNNRKKKENKGIRNQTIYGEKKVSFESNIIIEIFGNLIALFSVHNDLIFRITVNRTHIFKTKGKRRKNRNVIMM